MNRSIGEPEIASEDLEEIFSYIAQKAKGKFIVVLDEFSYLVEKDDSVPSMFQAVIDEVLKEKNLMLIICGSSISMMESLLGYKNPLYGRKTGHIKLDFLNFRYFDDFFPKLIEELKEKAKFVNWNNERRKEYYAVVARSFSVKTKQGECIDLKELEKILKVS